MREIIDYIDLIRANDGEDVKMRIIPVYEIMYNGDSCFGVYACEDVTGMDFTINGNFVQKLDLDQSYMVEGKISSYKGSKQISVKKAKHTKPVGERAVILYLQTLKGLKKRAYDIYDEYGESSIDILMNDPLEVAKKIHGIGEASVLNWKKQLDKMSDMQETIITLLDYGLTAKQAKLLYEKYGETVVRKIESNPYVLSKEIRGFGFLSCDKIARELDYPVKSPNRVEEGIVYVLEKASFEGHCYLPRTELTENAISLLSIKLTHGEMLSLRDKYSEDFKHRVGKETIVIDYDRMCKDLNDYNNASGWKKENFRHIAVEIEEELIKDVLKTLHLQGRTKAVGDKIYLEEYYDAEKSVAENVMRIINGEKEVDWKLEYELENYLSENNIELEDRQKEAVTMFSSSTGGLFVLNGHAGSGKTFSLKVILEMLNKMYSKMNKTAKILLLAPTGKASKVATKATGMECVTIHRGLMYNPELGFQVNSGNQLEEDIIIVDETSMLDIILADKLFQSIKKGAKVILLGDTKQLPSVGAGNVLIDLIESGFGKKITLDVVKRQGLQSGVIKNATAIINGEMIKQRDDTRDAYTIKRSTSVGVHEAIIKSTERLLDLGYNFADIQVLCPQKKTPIGVEYLNFLLQEAFNKKESTSRVFNKSMMIKLNPNRDEISRINLYFREGDKVIHVRNNYDMPWYKKIKCSYEAMGDNYTGITNGECGVIEEVREIINEDGDKEMEVIVKYDDMYIVYDDGVKELDHAYALTIHKSQGSSWRAIILPIMMQNYIMLDNNLFYTAYTRASEFITTIGEERAINHAIKTHRSRERYTGLREQLASSVALLSA